MWKTRKMKTKVCKKNGCGRTAECGKEYCHIHAFLSEKRKVFTRRGKSSEYHNLYETAKWRKTSREFLKKYPFCFICGKPARIADHITPHRGNLELFYDENNLQPMCWSCHSRKTFKENGNFRKDKRGEKNDNLERIH